MVSWIHGIVDSMAMFYLYRNLHHRPCYSPYTLSRGLTKISPVAQEGHNMRASKKTEEQVIDPNTL